MDRDRIDAKGAGALLLCLLLWAGAFPGITFALEDFTAGRLALLRFIFASLSSLAVIAVLRVRPPEKKDWLAFCLLGLYGVTLYHLFLYLGQETIKAGTASVLIACAPVVTAWLAWKVLGERFGPRGWAGTAIAFCGAFLISFGQGDKFGLSPGALYVLLAVLAAAGYNVTQKRVLKRYTPLEATLWPLVFGTVPLFVFAPGLWQEVTAASGASLLVVILLGVAPGTLAYLLWAIALKRSPASVVTSFLYLMPLLALTISWLWLGEIPSRLTIVGGALCLLGVVLVNLRGRNGAPSPVSPSAPDG